MKKISLYVFVLTTLFTVAFAKSSMANDELAGSAGNDHFFALLAGSNLPGDNQAPLRYAHRDMDRIREVLLEIGKHTPDHIHQLTDPDRGALTGALGQIKTQIAQLPPDTQSRFVFYYSGHAKANALTLGEEALGLDALRKLLDDIPASQKIIILDACQSGSFSRAKGVRLAEDFSHNSLATLQTRGTAVLASSSANELSQESDEMAGSIFTLNLVAGLRGAADFDANGRVSLFEAYDYAYNNTLVATADTQVGRQHATLEADFEGTGETILSWPEASSAKLVLPAELNGTVVIFEEKSNTVHAEIHKAEGSEVVLAFPPGRYGAMVTARNQALHCTLQLTANSATRLKKGSCQMSRLKPGVAKSDGTELANRRDSYRWVPFVELRAGIQFLRKDAFIRTLEQLDYSSDAFTGDGKGETIPYIEVLTGMSVNRWFSFGLLYSTLDQFTFRQETYSFIAPEKRTYSWKGHRINFQLCIQYPLFRNHLIPHLIFETGPGVVKDHYRVDTNTYYAFKDRREWGPVIGGGPGVRIRLYRELFLVAQWKYLYAPILSNLYSEKQDAGGWILSAGIRIGQ